jgi:hypothetical protein
MPRALGWFTETQQWSWRGGSGRAAAASGRANDVGDNG